MHRHECKVREVSELHQLHALQLRTQRKQILNASIGDVWIACDLCDFLSAEMIERAKRTNRLYEGLHMNVRSQLMCQRMR